MTTTLAELKAEAARLNVRIAELEGNNNRVTPPPVEDRGVRVVELLHERTDGPTLREMEKLYAAVRNLSPWPQALVDRYDESRPFRGFAASFRWLMNVPRADRPNGKVSLSFWLDTCRIWMRARNAMTSDLSANALILATFAVGDVHYCPADPQLGVTWEIGLLEFGGKLASPDSWKRILTGGAAAVLPPSSPARRTPPLSNVRVTVGY
jgi:hypothetical protein